MNKEELIKFLKENLDIQIQVINLDIDNYGIEVKILLQDEVISTDYDNTD